MKLKCKKKKKKNYEHTVCLLENELLIKVINQFIA